MSSAACSGEQFIGRDRIDLSQTSHSASLAMTIYISSISNNSYSIDICPWNAINTCIWRQMGLSLRGEGDELIDDWIVPCGLQQSSQTKLRQTRLLATALLNGFRSVDLLICIISRLVSIDIADPRQSFRITRHFIVDESLLIVYDDAGMDKMQTRWWLL